MENNTPNSILVPAPTAWPLALALGFTLVAAGLVMSAVISIVGAVIVIRAAVGWWYDVLPEQREELIPATPATPVVRSSLAVNYLAPGHRAVLPIDAHPYWAGVWGGLAGAVAMAVVAMLFGLISQGSIWYPINLLGAGVLTSLAEASTETLRHFSSSGLIAGVLIHGIISVFVGLLYAVSLPMFPRGATLRSGLVTPLLWSGLVASTLGFINPTLNARIDWGWFVGSQLAFGLVTAVVVARTTKIETMQNLPLARRAGIEGQEENSTQ